MTFILKNVIKDKHDYYLNNELVDLKKFVFDNQDYFRKKQIDKVKEKIALLKKNKN
jgi:hypothetical protein